jgi:hypothetical protein
MKKQYSSIQLTHRLTSIFSTTIISAIVNKAGDYLNKYIANSDQGLRRIHQNRLHLCKE